MTAAAAVEARQAADASAQSEIRVRKPQFDLSSDIPHYWYAGQPFATHYLNALSSVFPDGEAFFVRSVWHYRDRVDDPRLRERIGAFAAQEGQHSHQHRSHVDLLLAQGYRLIGVRNRIIGHVLRWQNRHLPRFSLAITAALEHLTALLARQLLSRPEFWTEPMDPRMAPLWRWHALEEAEHKSVAFDVLMLVAPQRWLRMATMLFATFGLLMDSMLRTTYMLWVDGRLWDRKVWSDGLHWLLGRGGLFRGLEGDYVRWFRRGFHPDDVDDSRLIAAERAFYESNSVGGEISAAGPA